MKIILSIVLLLLFITGCSTCGSHHYLPEPKKKGKCIVLEYVGTIEKKSICDYNGNRWDCSINWNDDHVCTFRERIPAENAVR